MQDIVKASGSSIGNIYFYFDNKNDLLRTLLEDALTASWARSDDILTRTPPGPRKLALVMMATALGLLQHDRDLTRLIAGNGLHEDVQQRLIELNTPRVVGVLLESYPHLDTDQLDLLVSAWAGGARHCLLLGAATDGRHDPLTVGTFIIRWNLRGIGVPDDQITDAITFAAEALDATASRDA
jgi:AcrR family transcriptional regulator